MNVAFISRATLYSSPGGDTKQLDQTAAGLRDLGVNVDVHLASDSIDYGKYDLLHFFNIIRPADILRHTSRAKLPYVVSTIFVEYNNVAGESFLKRTLLKLLGADGMEYIKVLARRIKNGDRIGSASYLLRGHRRAVQDIARGAAMLLPNSNSEYRRFVRRYGIERPYRVVPNGVNTAATSTMYPAAPDYKDAIICMARIEPIKNQLNLVRAFSESPRQLFIHGKAAPNHHSYYEACRNEAGANVHIAGWLDEQALYAAYSAARVHVLPSFFETTGLSSLEAAVMGCNIVVTDRGDTRDYFGNNAWYCNPEDPDSIRAAIEAAYNAPYNPEFRKRILENFTWQRAAEETLKAYQQILP